MASGLFAGTLGWAAPAAAQGAAATDPATRGFAIPAQPLAAALDAFARQTSWQIGYPGGLAAGRNARAVSGTMTPAQALDALLAGTGLAPRMTGPGTAVLVEVAPAASSGPDEALLLAPVSVSAATLGWQGVATTAITAAELERKNPTDIRDVFSGEPGIRVGSSLPMSQKVYVNGVEETNLAVTIDGSRQTNRVFHHNGTTLIDPSFLRAVRVDAGVAPADAGPGALAGAIAYETKDARDFLATDGVGAFVKSVYDANAASLTSHLSGYGRHEAVDGLVYLTYGKGGEFSDGNGDTVQGTKVDLVSGLVKGAVEFAGGNRLQASYERVRDDAPRPFRANVGSISGRPAWEPRVRDYTLDRQNAVLSYSVTAPTALWNPKIVLAHGRTEVETPIYLRPVAPSTTAGRMPGRGEVRSLNGKAENTFSFPLGTLTAGTDFYRDEASYDDPTYEATERARNNGLYLQTRLEPVEGLRLSAGVRGDRQTFEGTTGEEWTHSGVSYNASGEIDLVPRFLTAKAGFSRGWAGIPLAETFIMNSAWRYGDGPDPVTSENSTLGLEARYEGFTVEGRVFQTRLYDARAARFAAASATLAHDVKSKGFEVGVGYVWQDGFVRAKYADIDVTIDGQPADSDTGTYLATPMGRILTLGGGHTIRAWNLTVGADLEIVADYDKVPAGQQPLRGYEVVNAYVEYRPTLWEGLTLRADLRNLFDETYADRATYGQEFGTVTPLYQPGRTLLLTASARF